MKTIGEYKIEFDDRKVCSIYRNDKLIYKEEYTEELDESLTKIDKVLVKLNKIKKVLENKENIYKNKSDSFKKVSFIFWGLTIFALLSGLISTFIPITLTVLSMFVFIHYSDEYSKLSKKVLSFDKLIDQQLEEYHNIEDLINENKYVVNNTLENPEAKVEGKTIDLNKTLIK